ncbi:Prenylcysteine oxidase [Gracilaria domingensis]|nr:Prenylcysteine oxidase [Gracilaria domingensis]
MKIAVVGGNLLGCATTLDLALVAEHDQQNLASEEPFSVTVLDRKAELGGNSLRSVQVDDGFNVEVGSYATLPIVAGTYLYDLVDAANDGRGTVSLLNRRLAIPGATVARRGQLRAAVVNKPWASGSYGSLIRRYALWDWKEDKFPLVYKGWPFLDLLYRLLNNNIWRSIAFAMFLYSAEQLRSRVAGKINRAVMMAQCLVCLVLTIISPKRVIHMWQQNYSFWGTTAPLLFQYGITPAIARGGVTGFVKLISRMNEKNVATCSISVGSFVQRAELDSYLRSTAQDYANQFQYKREYVDRHIAPTVIQQNTGASMKQVNAMALQFSMLECDPMNSDGKDRLCTIAPDNATLCKALIDAAKATMSVEVKLGTNVAGIIFCDESKKYNLTYSDGARESFDGVVLCASVKEGEVTIDTPVGNSLSDLLGYDRDKETAQESAREQASYEARESDESTSDSPEEEIVSPRACSHVAVVVGKARSSFFRFADERGIPECIDVIHSPDFSRFERVREVSDEKPGVYKILCGEEFETSGLMKEMFEDGSRVEYFEAIPRNAYSTSALPRQKHVDDCMPYIVLGRHFIYAKALRRIAKHPEMDAIAAVNSASLFSKAVHWGTEDVADKIEGNAQSGENRE